MENVRFGVDSHFLRMSREKRSFWEASFSVFGKVSWKPLVLEVWIGKSRGKRSFCKTSVPSACLSFLLARCAIGAAASGRKLRCVIHVRSLCRWAVAPTLA